MVSGNDTALYEFAKDFAGPIATAIASLVALIVTIIFNSRQIQISSSQRDVAAAQKDIAFDKLKHDLFARRYEIYSAARELIICAAKHDYERTPPTRIVELKVKLDESRFFFSKDIQALASEIEDACEDVMSKADHHRHQNPDDEVAWPVSADSLSDAEERLRTLFAELPSRFSQDLAFDQLTREQR